MAMLKRQWSRIFYKKVKFVVHHNGYFLEYSVFVTGGSCIFTVLTVLFYPTPKCWVLIFVVCCHIPVSVECLIAGISAINIINSTCLMNLMFVCPCIASIIANDNQQVATILVYLFIPNQLYIFWAMFLPIIRST